MTFTDKIREAARKLKEFRSGDLTEAVEVRSYRERKAVYYCVSYFFKSGEIERIDDKTYRYVGREQITSLRQRLWDIARRMIYFSIDDLEQIAQGNRGTISRFCSWMFKEGYARRIRQGHYKTLGRLKPDVPPKKDKRN